MPNPPFQSQAPGRNVALSGKPKTERQVLWNRAEGNESKQKFGTLFCFTMNFQNTVGVVRNTEAWVAKAGNAIVLVWLNISATVCKTLREAAARQIQRLGIFASTVMSRAVKAVLVSVHALLANRVARSF